MYYSHSSLSPAESLLLIISEVVVAGKRAERAAEASTLRHFLFVQPQSGALRSP